MATGASGAACAAPPVVRTPTTPRWLLLLVAWFTASTAWVFAMSRLPGLNREARLPYFVGFALMLTALNAGIVAVAYHAIGAMPELVAAALVFLMPMYFLMALWGAARSRADYVAFSAGLVLGPAFAFLTPAADLLLAGILGGTIAYVAGRMRRS